MFGLFENKTPTPEEWEETQNRLDRIENRLEILEKSALETVRRFEEDRETFSKYKQKTDAELKQIWKTITSALNAIESLEQILDNQNYLDRSDKLMKRTKARLKNNRTRVENLLHAA